MNDFIFCGMILKKKTQNAFKKKKKAEMSQQIHLGGHPK